jgi:chromosomal replication initiator protein
MRPVGIEEGNFEDPWSEHAEQIRKQVSESTWQLWLAGIKTTRFSDGELILSVPNGLILDRVNARYLPLIVDVLTKELGSSVTVRLELDRAAIPADGNDVARSVDIDLMADVELSRDIDLKRDSVSRSIRSASTERESFSAVQLDAKFTFETFVAASSNRLAHAAAQAVAETPGRSYNPLFIYGGTGLGKTHLLHAIGNYVTEKHPRRKVLYVTTETFMNDFVDSLRSSSTLAFKRRYRECDLLLIDDVQFMERKEGLQEEFFHTYNDLKGASKQIVLTSDRPPRSIEHLEDRLHSRFLSGLITEIDTPDLETRLAILQLKAARERLDAPDDVLEFIAKRVRSNIRDLEGALNRASAFARVNGTSLDMETVRKGLSDLETVSEPNRITPQRILAVSASSYAVSVEAICGSNRSRPIVDARQVAMYLMRELTNYSYPAIARLFDKRDATTVAHAVEKISRQLREHHQIEERVSQLTLQLRAEADAPPRFSSGLKGTQSVWASPLTTQDRSLQLGETLAQRFAQTGSLDDLNRTIAYLEEARNHLAHDGKDDSVPILDALANAYRSRFELLHDARDLDTAILLQERAIAANPLAPSEKV